MNPDILGQLSTSLQGFITRELETRREILDRRDDRALAEIISAAGTAGLLHAPVPPEHGGSGLGPDLLVYLLEKLASSCPALAALMASHFSGLSALLSRQPDAEKNGERIKALAGDQRSPGLISLAIWEDPQPTDFHSFLGSIQTRMHLSGSGHFVTGRKTGLFSSPHIPFLFVLARDDQNQLRWALVGSGSNGVSSRNIPAMGLRLCPFSDLDLAEITVLSSLPTERSIFTSLMDGFHAAVGVGIARGALDRALKYILERYQGGGMICDHDAVRNIVADRTISIEAARSLAYRSVSTEDTRGTSGGADPGAAAFAAELAPEVALDAIQLLGGYGYMEDYQIERFLRDAKTFETLVVRARARKSWYAETVIENEKIHGRPS